MPKGIPKDPRISPKCPPILRRLIEQEGSRVGAAHASKTGTTTVAKIANGEIEMTAAQQARFEDAVKPGAPTPRIGGGIDPTPEPPPIAIPPWNGKVSNVKMQRKDGTNEIIKKVPDDFIKILKQNGMVFNKASIAIGYSSWGTVKNMIEKGKYEERLHPNVYRMLHGLPLPAKTNGKLALDMDTPDSFQLGIAICVIALNDFPHLEEVAEVIGGHMTFKMSAGSIGWIVIYRFTGRDKLEKFKRLARHAAKRIVCP